MKTTDSKRTGVPSSKLVAAILVLLIIAISGYGLYFAGNSSPRTVTLTSISLSTITITSTTSVVVGPSGTATTFESSSATSSSTSTSTSSTALVFQGTLIIIPEGVAKNQSLDFTPPTIRVVVGINNTVTWLNQDPLSQHTVVTESTPSGAQNFAAVLKTGQTFTTTFTIPGTYHYYCMWHPDWMKGTIIVGNR